MNSALVIIFLFLLISFYLGIKAKRGKDMNLEQWSVGGRGFGSIFVFLLMAGEIYTTFTFLGASGWAYGKGAPTYYIIAYGSLAYVLSYWILPKIWSYSKEKKLVSQSDYFVAKYNSPYLGVLVSIVGVVALVPYLILQLQGLGNIVSVVSYGTISPTLAIWIAVISITVYVMISGIHGSAWTAVIKDIMILGVVLFLGIYLPIHYYGGFQPMFEAIDQAKPGFLTFPKTGMSVSWFISTVLLTAIGFYMWPHTFGSVYSAKSRTVFRKNAIFLPLYQLALLFVFFVGFAALLQVPGLTGSDTDLALLKLSVQTFDPWIVGLIGAAGLLTAIVPGSMILMSSATLLSKNVYHVFVPTASEKQISRLAKWLVPVISLVSLYLTFRGGSTIVALLLMGYSLVTQLAPAIFLSLSKKPLVTKPSVFAGIIVGVATVLYITISGETIATLFPSLPSVIQDLNVGIIALGLNLIVTFIVTLLTPNKSQVSTKTKTVA